MVTDKRPNLALIRQVYCVNRLATAMHFPNSPRRVRDNCCNLLCAPINAQERLDAQASVRYIKGADKTHQAPDERSWKALYCQEQSRSPSRSRTAGPAFSFTRRPSHTVAICIPRTTSICERPSVSPIQQ